MIVTVAKVTELDRFLEIFRTLGADKRREHGCRSARVYIDPGDAQRVWSIFDWDDKDYAGFLADPERFESGVGLMSSLLLNWMH